MKRVQIVLNSLGILCFLLVLATNWTSLSHVARVTELDRAGVFNEAVLKESFPHLAENLRYNVADYIAGNHRHRAHALCVVGLTLLSINVLISALGKRASKETPTEATANQSPDRTC